MEPQSVGRGEVNLSLATHAAFRPPRNQRIAERPISLEAQGAAWPRSDRMPRQPPGERQRVEEGAGELEVEVLRVHVRVTQSDETRVGRAERGDATRHYSATVDEPERVERHLEHARAVGAQPYVPGYHTVPGASSEAPVDEADIPERCGVRMHPEIEQQRTMRPGHQPARITQCRSG